MNKGNIKQMYLKIRYYIDIASRNLKIKNKGKSNRVYRPKTNRYQDCTIIINGNNNVIRFGDYGVFRGLSILIEGDNNILEIGNHVSVNASAVAPTRINIMEGKQVIVGDGCLFSNMVELHTSDYHGIYDINGTRINAGEDIVIGSNCWIGLRALLLKGSKLPNNCIVGAGAIVSGQFHNNNTILAGIPAKEIKKGVVWDIERKDKLLVE